MRILLATIIAFALAQQALSQEILEFSASWCPPCQQMKPIVSELKKAGYPIKVIDIDKHRDLAQRLKVTAIPAFVGVNKERREAGRIVGATTRERLIALYRQTLPKARQKIALTEDEIWHPDGVVPIQFCGPNGCYPAQPYYGDSPNYSAPSQPYQGTVQGSGGNYQVAPLEPQQPWSNPRVVKLRNADNGGFTWLSGSVVAFEGDPSYVLTCAHGLEGVGDPVLVVYHDGSTEVGEVIALERGPDCAILKLPSAREEFYTLAEAEPAGGTVWTSAFPNAKGLRERPGRFRFSNTSTWAIEGGAVSGESGGAVLDEYGQVCGVVHSTNGRETFCCRLPILRRLVSRIRSALTGPAPRPRRPPQPRAPVPPPYAEPYADPYAGPSIQGPAPSPQTPPRNPAPQPHVCGPDCDCYLADLAETEANLEDIRDSLATLEANFNARLDVVVTRDELPPPPDMSQFATFEEVDSRYKQLAANIEDIGDTLESHDSLHGRIVEMMGDLDSKVTAVANRTDRQTVVNNDFQKLIVQLDQRINDVEAATDGPLSDEQVADLQGRLTHSLEAQLMNGDWLPPQVKPLNEPLELHQRNLSKAKP